MTSPFSNGFSHGFPMIYGDLWWFKPLQKQVGLQATKNQLSVMHH